MYDSDPHVYMSLTDINETNHTEEPSLPSESPLRSRQPISLRLLALLSLLSSFLLVVEVPIPNFASTVPCPTHPVESFFKK